MVHDPGQGLQADAAFTDAGVAVLPGAAGVQAVVEVDGLQPVQADDAVKLRQYAVQVVCQVVPGIGGVAGVQADPHFRSQVHLVQDLPQLFKPAAHLAALAGHGFQQHGGGLLCRQDGVEPVGYVGDARFDPLAHVAAGVEVIKLAGEMFHAAEVVRQKFLGKEPVFLLPAAEV